MLRKVGHAARNRDALEELPAEYRLHPGDRGSQLLLTGHRPSPVLVHPSLGSVLAGEGQA